MSFFKKLFGKDKQIEPAKEKQDQLTWIEPADNKWGVRILDLRPISQTMLSTSKDPQMAANAISYRQDDGQGFWQQPPGSDPERQIDTHLSIPLDGPLYPGVLFIPQAMEHKWAIFFDGTNIIFVRSWLRKVFVIASTQQRDGQLIIDQIRGSFSTGEDPAFTISILRFLLISHCIGEKIPAPIPAALAANTKDAGLWAFSTYGNMAHFGIFDTEFSPKIKGSLHSHSLLHIAVAKSDLADIEKQAANGIAIDSLAGDGLAPLHWSIAPATTNALKTLLALGAMPDVPSIQGATPLMNAVQAIKIEHLEVLLQAGADVNARDTRGFTALHRAAEMGLEEIVESLLRHGADKTIEAAGHTALSLARAREHQRIIRLLE